MAGLIYLYQAGELDYLSFRTHAVYKLLNMKRGAPGINDDFKFSNIYQLSELVDSFFEEEEEGRRIIKQYYINNPVPFFRSRLFCYYGPADEFNNVKFGEYVDGLGHYTDFHQTGDPHYLYLLLATFYRRRKPGTALAKFLETFNGDERVRYNPESVAARAKKFKMQHTGIVFGFYLLFASFQKYITTAQLYVAGNEIDLSVLFDEGSRTHKESDLPGIGMKSLMYSFAESGVYGDLERVREVPLWEALVRMYDLTKRSKDYEANQPK